MKKINTIIILSTFLFLSCGKDKKENVENEAAIPVQISSKMENTNSPFVTASGKIEAENNATISTRMMGYITKIHVKVGQKVGIGQLLVSINNTDLKAKKAQADASILQATSAYNNAKKDYDRFVALFAQQSASQKELDDMTSRYEMAKANLEASKQMRNEVVAQFNYSNLTAPFSGEITNTFVKEGDMANPGMPLLSLEGNGKMQVTAMITEANINDIKKGMTVKVNVKSLNLEVTGIVSEVSGSATNTGGQYLVKINLDKADKNILSGMFVNIQFPIQHSISTESKTENDKVLVPESALVKKGQLIGIYVVSNDKEAILRWLRIGKTFGNQVEVLSGLTNDEIYIISADGKLYNGVKVSIQ